MIRRYNPNYSGCIVFLSSYVPCRFGCALERRLISLTKLSGGEFLYPHIFTDNCGEAVKVAFVLFVSIDPVGVGLGNSSS